MLVEPDMVPRDGGFHRPGDDVVRRKNRCYDFKVTQVDLLPLTPKSPVTKGKRG
jgi:hypothetical protein